MHLGADACCSVKGPEYGRPASASKGTLFQQMYLCVPNNSVCSHVDSTYLCSAHPPFACDAAVPLTSFYAYWGLHPHRLQMPYRKTYKNVLSIWSSLVLKAVCWTYDHSCFALSEHSLLLKRLWSNLGNNQVRFIASFLCFWFAALMFYFMDLCVVLGSWMINSVLWSRPKWEQIDVNFSAAFHPGFWKINCKSGGVLLLLWA